MQTLGPDLALALHQLGSRFILRKNGLTKASDVGTNRSFAALRRFRQQCESRADEEWTQFKRRS
jgi:hypothetical protein